MPQRGRLNLVADLFPNNRLLILDERKLGIRANPSSGNMPFLNKDITYRGIRLVKDDKDGVRILLGLMCEETLPIDAMRRMCVAFPLMGGTRVRTAMVDDVDRKGDTYLLLTGPSIECAAGYYSDRRVWLSLSNA